MKKKNGLNIGINFIDAQRNVITSIQYVKNGVAIADLCFYNGQVQRCLIVPTLSDSFKTHFINAAKALASRNPPQDFRKTA